MKRFPGSTLPILGIAVYAVASHWFIEDPPYAVSPAHTVLVFALGIFAWFYGSFSVLRQSFGGYACGVAFGFLALTTGFLPDLWLRWPMVTVLGLGLSQAGAAAVYTGLYTRPKLRFEAAFGISVLAFLPLAALPYLKWMSGFTTVFGIVGGALLIVGLARAWKTRQSRFTLMGLMSWLLVGGLAAILYLMHFTGWHNEIAHRQQFELYLLFALVFMAGAFMADLLQVEQQLRSGPHMELDASLKDALTNLANRRALETFGPPLIAQSHKAGRAVSLVVADIDHFKDINDTYGHPVGDVVLRKIADALSAQVRKSDLVCRYGGEEFVIILPGSPLAPALRLAERMRANIESNSFEHGDLSLKNTVSFGVATTFPEEPASLAELIQKADQNLYRAKHAGRNRVMADALPTHQI